MILFEGWISIGGDTINILGNIAVFEYSVKPSRVSPKSKRPQRVKVYGIREPTHPRATRVRLGVWLSIHRFLQRWLKGVSRA